MHTFGGFGDADNIAEPTVLVSMDSANGSIVSGTDRCTGAAAEVVAAGGWNG